MAESPEATEYVAEIWIDPDWYRAQTPPEPLPTLGRPRVVLLAPGVNSVGRTVAGPKVDCGLDSGVSRSHAEIRVEAEGCFVVDVGSANGTYVALATDSLPTQAVERPTPVGAEHRIYLGGWTRLVVRPAVAQERNE